jgi:hypothetical protein
VECRKKAIRLGCNVVDTSSIYSDGDSELLFGQVVRELVDKEDIKREVRLSSFSSFPSSFFRHSSSSLLVVIVIVIVIVIVVNAGSGDHYQSRVSVRKGRTQPIQRALVQRQGRRPRIPRYFFLFLRYPSVHTRLSPFTHSLTHSLLLLLLAGRQPGLDYSLSPRVLEDQISASLERLGMERVDLLMLHNPEQLLEVHPVLPSLVRTANA